MIEPGAVDGRESPVEVIDVGDEYVRLSVPESVYDAERVIPLDLVEMGEDARNWFAWDLDNKVPRAPHNGGYAGKAKWGRDAVAWDNRVGGTFEDVLAELGGTVDGHVDDEWRFEDGEEPRELYPMCVVPHSDFQPDDGALMLVDLDDVAEPVNGGAEVLMTREAWDIIQRLDCYAELSTSMEGAHCFVQGEIPAGIDGKKIFGELDQGGHIEIYGAPANGRIIGTTWMHIDATPRHDVTERQSVIDELADELIDEDDKLSDAEQAQQVADQHRSANGGHDTSEGAESAYYGLNPEVIANTGPFVRHGSNGRGPHPKHGGTSTPDGESTNFAVSRSDGWTCWAHGDGGGALQLIAVIEGIRKCGNASNVMDDPVDALRTCLAARDEHAPRELEGESPPTQALRGVLEIRGMDYAEEGKLERANYELARELYRQMGYIG